MKRSARIVGLLLGALCLLLGGGAHAGACAGAVKRVDTGSNDSLTVFVLPYLCDCTVTDPTGQSKLFTSSASAGPRSKIYATAVTAGVAGKAVYITWSTSNAQGCVIDSFGILN